jgi:hypothetical protein
LVLAIVAINYGRISERVMTERSDRSIDIQMNLFQKSLDLQTQLFDKTMSTLESIGRSTGVTEQRLGDIHSYMQSPAFLKQIAGRAVEQTTSELTKSGKESQKPDHLEQEMAEKLTKNIVRELSAQWSSIGPTLQRPPAPVPATRQEAQSVEDRLRRSVRDLKRSAEASTSRQELRAGILAAVAAIPGAAVGGRVDSQEYWDYLVSYKDKKLAIDLRVSRESTNVDVESYEESIRGLTRNNADYLLFAFSASLNPIMQEYFNLVQNAFPNRIYVTTTKDPSRLESDLRKILERPTASVQAIRQGPA